MGMTIDKVINNLKGILTESTEGENSVCYVTENDAETLQVAIATMRKYQKIREIVKSWKSDTWTDGVSYDCMVQISEVLEDGKTD